MQHWECFIQLDSHLKFVANLIKYNFIVPSKGSFTLPTFAAFSAAKMQAPGTAMEQHALRSSNRTAHFE